MSISVNSEPLEMDMAFPYLGHKVSYNNSNWAALYHNLWKARQWWGMVGKVGKKTGAAVWLQEGFYKEIVQLVFLYGSNSWVVKGAMLKLLEGFHHRSDIRIKGMIVQCTVSGDW